MIFIDSRKKAKKTLDKLYPNAKIIDVTSKGIEPFVRFSPLYPHGNIPVPFSKDYFSSCVEGIWQGLKVFKNEDIDISKFHVINMKDIKRTVRKYGNPIGHKKGVNGTEYLDYLTARKQIYLPTYEWILQNKLKNEVDLLISYAKEQDIVLLDYTTNEEIENLRKPLSHAALIKKYIYRKEPELSDKKYNHPKTITSKVEEEEVLKKSLSKRKSRPRQKPDKDLGQLNLNI